MVIINEHLAQELFPERNRSGPDASGCEPARRSTVVGVVKDTPQMSYEKPPSGELYLPYQQYIFGAFMSTIVVRTSGDPLALAAR